jgi:hypothetical protein
VLNAADQGVSGATVSIGGEGWSHATLTDAAGRYGFGGLCAGPASLQASLSGQVGPAALVTLTGENTVYLDLRLSSTGAASPSATTAPATTAVAGQTPTAEPDMPATGHSGWLLVGGAVLGAVLLLSAGARRLAGARERVEHQDQG